MTIPRVIALLTLLSLTSAIVDRTYYTYLGLDITASADEIAQAYTSKKEKIMGIEEEESRNGKLKILEEAYEVLGNAEKRGVYDRLNRDLYRKEKVVANLKRLTEKTARKSKTMQLTLPVSVEDIYHGKTVEATFLKQTACQKCKGTGAESPKFLNSCTRCGGNGFTLFEGVNQFGQKFVNENTCPLCQGWGKQVTKACPSCGGKKIVTNLEKAKIKIPKGLPDGNVIKVNNFGDEPLLGAPSDLQVTIVEIPTQEWSREGQNLVHTVPISLQEAIFGFEKTITHLNEEKIPIQRTDVTTRATTITIPQKGIHNPKTGKYGKLTIKFRIVMPKFTDQQLDMWQQFFRKHNL